MSKGRHKSSGAAMRGPGNPNVFKEAMEKKKGGKVNRASGGGVAGVGAAPVTKDIGRMSGGAVKARLDRPGRKTGGRVGANTSPLSTAHNTVSAPKTPGNNAGSN